MAGARFERKVTAQHGMASPETRARGEIRPQLALVASAQPFSNGLQGIAGAAWPAQVPANASAPQL
jgi:hypothetical protein